MNELTRNERSTVVAPGGGDGAVPVAVGAFGSAFSSSPTIAAVGEVDVVDVAVAGGAAREVVVVCPDEPQPAAIKALPRSAVATAGPRRHQRLRTCLGVSRGSGNEYAAVGGTT